MIKPKLFRLCAFGSFKCNKASDKGLKEEKYIEWNLVCMRKTVTYNKILAKCMDLTVVIKECC